ncbi:GatB/YqeY domain-containing protein [Clostridium oryzae]|uniref:Glutamyl-tRNA(Gln) amidotransferase subunit E n=1 Tax=Clostridium oryzae TaxID=1450648 RepID=A0A1V4IVC6_9CLOT|nr:GatB/YqeY domain-containing protein [Clostridium oryzae]OPJ63853.1 glutamyl-tRNA(Gln) amidotransferase subunit E [Clostridium oryzae]
MPIKERLQEDWKQALKAKDKFKADTISMAKAAVLLVEKSGKGDGQVTDEDIIEILAREVKQRRESIVEFEKGKRQDLVDKAKAEIEILLDYLPQQLSEEEISKIVHSKADEIGANNIKDMGKLMSAVMPELKGKADGKLVNKIVRELLNK